MSFTMPYGYGSTTLTEAQLNNKTTFNRCHPELRKRFLALAKFLAGEGIPLGVGTGWRVQPTNKPGFASPGNSWHEGVPVSSQQNALAIDTVPASSWNAMEPHLARFGLRSFRHVNNEPWHIQLKEIPASRRWATSLPPIQNFPVPGGSTAPSTPSQQPVPSTPSPSLFEGMPRDQRVAQLQNICNFWGWGNCGNADGLFGPRTKAAVKVMQSKIGASQDGRYGPDTRAKLIKFVQAMMALNS